jgi:hypothetical protein
MPGIRSQNVIFLPHSDYLGFQVAHSLPKAAHI